MENKQLLKQGSYTLGIDLLETQMDQFYRYKDLLLQWNEKMNLTAITDEKEIIIKHFLDSMSIGSKWDKDVSYSVIDIGTGAGFPGIPVKIAFPGIHITLVDALNKRIQFLEEVIKELNLTNVTCIHERAEDLGKDQRAREQYDMCISRAVAHLAVLSEYCLPFVKVDGVFIALKGPDITEEVQEAEKAITILGGKIVKQEKIIIPHSDITHSLIFIQKVKSTPAKYPRKAGKPNKNPIQ
jgi:16S rRNA (guanine527-N7)-methyltransferase